MWIDDIDSLFSLVCCGNDARSFAMNGHVLPFCQRCSGVYLGLAVTFLYLLMVRGYRRGLPPAGILGGIIASVGVMVVFGYHWVDPGPAWRFWSGLVFGNAVAWLLLPAAAVLWQGQAARDRGHSMAGYLVLLAALSAAPLWFPLNVPGAYAAVCGLALIGFGGAVLCAAVALAAAMKCVVKSVWKGVTHGYAGN